MCIAKTMGEVRFDHDQIDGFQRAAEHFGMGTGLAHDGGRQLGSPLPKKLKRSKLTTQYRLIRRMSVIIAVER